MSRLRWPPGHLIGLGFLPTLFATMRYVVVVVANSSRFELVKLRFLGLSMWPNLISAPSSSAETCPVCNPDTIIQKIYQLTNQEAAEIYWYALRTRCQKKKKKGKKEKGTTLYYPAKIAQKATPYEPTPYPVIPSWRPLYESNSRINDARLALVFCALLLASTQNMNSPYVCGITWISFSTRNV